MPFLQLRSRAADETFEFEVEVVRIGRDPICELVVSGERGEVVSGLHTRIVHRNGKWWIDDLESRNGTFLNEDRLASDEARELPVGAVIGLGGRGPRYVVEAVQKRVVEETIEEDPDLTLPIDRAEAPPVPPPQPEPPEPPAEPKKTATIILLERRTDEHFRVECGRIRIGRGKECDLRPIGPEDTPVSRVHAEIVLRPDGMVVVRDAQSRNGTFVNGERVTGDAVLGSDDVVQLGPTGPELVVLDITLPGKEKPRKPKAAAKQTPQEESQRKSKSAAARAAEKLGAARRSFGGKGATIFFNEMFQETSQKSARKLRIVVWSFVAVIAVGVAITSWYKVRLDQQLQQQQEQIQAQRAVADSMRDAATVEYQRLQLALDAAEAGSAPRAVVESLQVALSVAQERTTALENALQRAEESLAQQLAAGERARSDAQDDLERLRGELESRQSAGTPESLLDSLRAAVRATEERAAAIQTQMDAVRGGNLASVAQANQSAVGLVTAFIDGEIFDGSGFVITSSGYFVTNRHVLQPRGHPRADSVFVTLADQRSTAMLRTVIVRMVEAPGPDLALLKIQDFSGPHVPRIDWTGTNARQGEPAALIGFPAGFGNAIDQSGHVRTSMTAGIFAKVTNETINFDGFTVGGSSGSPIFNASGEVVGVHRSGLAEAVGMGFAVPVSRVRELLPQAVRAELGLN